MSRSRVHGGLGLRLAMIASLLSACGGGDSSDEQGTGFGAAPAPATCNADLSRLAARVYVSTLGSDAAGCGATPATACRSIGQGIANCSGAGCGVLVRHGLYATSQTIALRDGVSVYGSCRFDGEANHAYRTTITAATAPGLPAITALGIDLPTVLQGLVVIGQDQTAAGSASLALAIDRSRGLVLTGNVLVGGRGGDGRPGNSPSAATAGVQGRDGAYGGAGGGTCPTRSDPVAGQGGQGGTDTTTATYVSFFNWSCQSSDTGSDGQQSGSGRPGGTRGTKGAHGIACGDRPHDEPGSGTVGQAGPPGACGAAARASTQVAGSFAGTVWSPSQGDDGQSGSVGGGGGGGGAGGACVSETEGVIYGGLPGGGGGGGGCGGGGGGAGQQGGASMPLVIADSPIVVDAGANSVIPGLAGRGGDGGNAVPGAPGGYRGGGQTNGWTRYLSHQCGGGGNNGGNGGVGGAGSAGAAGHGGPSIGIALIGRSSAPSNLDSVYAAQPGGAGRIGRGGGLSPGGDCSGADGPAGVAGTGGASLRYP